MKILRFCLGWLTAVVGVIGWLGIMTNPLFYPVVRVVLAAWVLVACIVTTAVLLAWPERR